MGCKHSGVWLIEGIWVRRLRRDHWVIDWVPGERRERVRSLYEAKGAIADAINDKP